MKVIKSFTKNHSYHFLGEVKKESALFATKLTKKIPDPTKAKGHYELFFKKEKHKKIPKASKTVKTPQTPAT